MTLKQKAATAVEKVHEVQPVHKVKSLGRFIPNSITTRHGRAVLKLQKHSPAILFGVGITAGVATVVTACTQTLKLEGVLEDTNANIANAKQVLEDHPQKYSLKDYQKDMAVIRIRSIVRVGRLYALPAGLGIISVAALTGSHHILNQRNLALTAAYGTLDRGFKEYRARVAEELGEDKEREIRHGVREQEVAVETKSGTKKSTAKFFANANSPYARVYDELSARNWKPNPHSNRMFIQVQQNWANDLLQARGHVFLNEVYDMLGLDRSKEGQVVGWVLGNGDDYIDFGIMTKTGSDERVHEFMFGTEASVLLDFNVDGNVLDLI